MNRQMTCGTSSISFQNPVFIQSCASVVSRKEGEGPLGNAIDQIIEDPYFGQKSWELAEGRFMKQAAMLAISKARLHTKDIRYAFAGDLLEQNTSGYEYCRRLCKACTCSCLKSYWKCGKTVSFSFGIWESKTVIFNMDSHRFWRVCCIR